jgi:thioredoxin-related protein
MTGKYRSTLLLGIALVGSIWWFFDSGTLFRLGVLEPEKIHWEVDYRAAVERAKAEKKPVLVMFFEPESLDFQRLEQVTFSDRNVVDILNKEAVCVMLIKQDAEELYARYGGNGLPLLIWHEAEGPEVFRFVGFRPPRAFLDTMPDPD